MDTSDDAVALAVIARARLFAMLARFFSYPSRDEAERRTTLGPASVCLGLMERIGAADAEVRAAYEELARCLESPACDGGRSQGEQLRIELTRLTMGYPRLICLEGSGWVKERTEDSCRFGEEFAVRNLYRELGLRNKPGVNAPADSLVSELDFASYLTCAEAFSWEENDALSAQEWRSLREGFTRDHLKDMALGVSQSIRELSDNAFLLFYAVALRAAVVSSSEPLLNDDEG